MGIHLYQLTNQYNQWIQEPWDLSTAINNNKHKPMELTIQNTHHFYSGIPCSISECRHNVLQHPSEWNQWLRSELDGCPTLAENTGEHTRFLYEKGGNRSVLAKKAKWDARWYMYSIIYMLWFISMCKILLGIFWVLLKPCNSGFFGFSDCTSTVMDGSESL